MNKLKLKKFLIFSFVFTLSGAMAGSGFEIKKHVISSGGGISEGGGYTINGSIAQITTEKSSGGSFSISSGFWQAQSDLIFKNSFE